MQNFDHNIGFWEKRQFFRQKVSKIAKNCDHNIDPWQDSISRPMAPISSVAGGDDTTIPHHQREKPKKILIKNGTSNFTSWASKPRTSVLGDGMSIYLHLSL
jgi:hypothetical protein